MPVLGEGIRINTGEGEKGCPGCGIFPERGVINTGRIQFRPGEGSVRNTGRIQIRSGGGSVKNTGKLQIFPDGLHFLFQPGFDLYRVFRVPKVYFFISQHAAQMVVVGNSHVSVVRVVNISVFQKILNFCHIGTAVRHLVHGAPGVQMRQHPCIDLVIPVGV